MAIDEIELKIILQNKTFQIFFQDLYRQIKSK